MSDVDYTTRAAETFTRHYGERVARARKYFAWLGLDPDARDEAVQNTACLAWKRWSRLADLGRAEEALMIPVWRYSMRQTRAGRSMVGARGRKPRRDVYDRGRGRDLARGMAERLPARGSSVGDAVAFRLDFKTFLSTLKPRARAMAEGLAEGLDLAEVAERVGVTPAAVCNFRHRSLTPLKELRA